jgi:Carboxypeptidase regulatory-like domain
MSRGLFRIIQVAALCLWTSTIWAQATGAIDGTVFDKSGVVVPGAHVTATNVNTNFVRRVTSDGSGRYTLIFMPFAADHSVGSAVVLLNCFRPASVPIQLDFRQIAGFQRGAGV